MTSRTDINVLQQRAVDELRLMRQASSINPVHIVRYLEAIEEGYQRAIQLIEEIQQAVTLAAEQQRQELENANQTDRS